MPQGVSASGSAGSGRAGRLNGLGRSLGLLACGLELAAFHRDEARAEALHAGVVLVAAVLVDAALAAELGFHRLHAQAVALHRAVAAAFAHQLVDHHALGRLDQRAALAAAALLGGAGLVVDQDGAARQLAQLLLDGIELVAVVHRHARGQPALHGLVLLGLVGDDDDLLRAFGVELAGHLGHPQRAVDRLAAGHRHRVVEQDLVGDVDPAAMLWRTASRPEW